MYYFAEGARLELAKRLITVTAVFKTAALPIRLPFHFADEVGVEPYTVQFNKRH